MSFFFFRTKAIIHHGLSPELCYLALPLRDRAEGRRRSGRTFSVPYSLPQYGSSQTIWCHLLILYIGRGQSCFCGQGFVKDFFFLVSREEQESAGGGGTVPPSSMAGMALQKSFLPVHCAFFRPWLSLFIFPWQPTSNP